HSLVLGAAGREPARQGPGRRVDALANARADAPADVPVLPDQGRSGRRPDDDGPPGDAGAGTGRTGDDHPPPGARPRGDLAGRGEGSGPVIPPLCPQCDEPVDSLSRCCALEVTLLDAPETNDPEKCQPPPSETHP